jgi:hypothetical protein
MESNFFLKKVKKFKDICSKFTFDFASDVINVSTDAGYFPKVLRFSAVWKKMQVIFNVKSVVALSFDERKFRKSRAPAAAFRNFIRPPGGTRATDL